VGHKGKGRKGDKGKGRKRDRANDEASIDTPVAPAEAMPEVAAAPAVEVSPRVSAPKVTRPRVSTPKAPARAAAERAAAARPVAAHGTERPTVERLALPTDRASLLVLHQAARRQRDAAPLLSSERAEATFEIERIEVQIARVERAMDPPLV
jgi:hypothetical protein